MDTHIDRSLSRSPLPDGCVIRAAAAADRDAVYALICEMEQKTLDSDAFSAIFAHQLQSGGYLHLIFEQEGAAAGFLSLRMERQLHHAAAVAEVLELVVAPAHRGRGLGSALLSRACREAAARGCVQLEVACNRLRQDAHRFYRREGLRPFHLRFSRSLTGETPAENKLGV